MSKYIVRPKKTRTTISRSEQSGVISTDGAFHPVAIDRAPLPYGQQPRDSQGKYAAYYRPEPDFNLAGDATVVPAGAERDDDCWNDDAPLPAALEHLCLQAPGWSSIVTRFWEAVQEVSAHAAVTAVFDGSRELRVLSAVASDENPEATATLRDEADFLELLAATTCPACGNARPPHTDCVSRFCNDNQY